MARRLAAVLAVLSVLAASGWLPQASAQPRARGADAASEHRRIVGYWTPERRDTAVPRDLTRPAAKPNDNGNGKGKPGGGDGEGDTSTVTGAAWTAGGAVTLTAGKVFFTLGATRYTCSGSAVAGGNGSLVLTAGHCLHAGNGGAFATNWVFYPAYNGGPHPALGAWTATDLFTTNQWASSADFDHDAGFAVATNGTPTTLASALSAHAATPPQVTFELGSHSGDYYAFGYPAAKKYKGQTLVYCAGPVRERYDGNQTLAMSCDMTGGSSGGPWYHQFADGTGVVNSLNSYGYASLNNVMFGPVFDAPERAAYAGASASGGCSPSPAYVCVRYSG